MGVRYSERIHTDEARESPAQSGKHKDVRPIRLVNENLFIYTRLDAKRIHACTSLVKPARIEAAILKVCNAELPGIDPRVGFLLVGVKTQGYAIATCTHGWGLTQGHHSKEHPIIQSNIKYSLQCVGRRSKTIALISANLPEGQTASPINLLFNNLWNNMAGIMLYVERMHAEPTLHCKPGSIVFDPFNL